MKKFFKLFAFAFIVALNVIPCYAQYENYYKVNNSTYITTIPNAKLYELPSEHNATNRREIIYTQNSKIKKIKKSQQLRVVRLTNTSKQEDFNAYIVEYKDRLWTLYSSEVQNDSILKERNSRMLQDKNYLETKYQKLKSQLDISSYQFISNALSPYMIECKDSLNYYKNLKTRLPSIRDSLVAVKKAQEQAKVYKAYKDWYNALPASTKKAASIISITEAALGSPNSVGGCDYSLYYTNKSKKTIKYLYWSGCVYNAVNDLVSCKIRNRYYFSGKDTGPVAHGENGGGCWECIIYNYSADRLKLDDIHITYMDGTSASIAGADIRRLLNEPSTYVNISAYDVRNQVISDSECQNKINIWQERLDNIEKHKFHKGWYEKYHNSDNSYDKVWLSLASKKSEINTIQNEVNKTKKELEKFNKFISFEIYTDSKSSGLSSNYEYNSINKYSTKKQKTPFVVFGIEGSIEGLKSFSTGWGVSMRIGRFNSLFNATIGLKYQYTGYKRWVSYLYKDYYGTGLYDYDLHNGWGDYKCNVSQLVIPIVANCNIVKNDNFSYYLGVGYEHGFLLSTNQGFYNKSSDFSEYDFYRSEEQDDLVRLSIPSRTIVFQMGFAGRHWDWKAYYKLYANKSKFINGDSGAIGTAFTYYF